MTAATTLPSSGSKPTSMLSGAPARSKTTRKKWSALCDCPILNTYTQAFLVGTRPSCQKRPFLGGWPTVPRHPRRNRSPTCLPQPTPSACLTAKWGIRWFGPTATTTKSPCQSQANTSNSCKTKGGGCGLATTRAAWRWGWAWPTSPSATACPGGTRAQLDITLTMASFFTTRRMGGTLPSRSGRATQWAVASHRTAKCFLPSMGS
mmetsp:Transcript_48946/g.123130  ORF Transcript_48946/g.123130 Transcript_48946/m.123130 type:complete len:206 (+) Transcript_48946:669-1286(+)